MPNLLSQSLFPDWDEKEEYKTIAEPCDIYSNIIEIVPVSSGAGQELPLDLLYRQSAERLLEMYSLYELTFQIPETALQGMDAKDCRDLTGTLYSLPSCLQTPFLSYNRVFADETSMIFLILSRKDASGQILDGQLLENKEYKDNLDKGLLKHSCREIGIQETADYLRSRNVSMYNALLSACFSKTRCVGSVTLEAEKKVLDFGEENQTADNCGNGPVDEAQTLEFPGEKDWEADSGDQPDRIVFRQARIGEEGCHIYLDLLFQNYVRCCQKKYVEFHGYKPYEQLDKYFYIDESMVYAGISADDETKLYIKRQFRDSRNSSLYYDLTNTTTARHKSTKYHVYEDLFHVFNKTYKNILNMRQKPKKGNVLQYEKAEEAQYLEHLTQRTEEVLLNLVVHDQQDALLKDKQAEIAEQIGDQKITKTFSENKFKVRCSEEVMRGSDVLNLVLVRSKDYYQKHSVSDPYVADHKETALNHMVVSDGKDLSEAALITVLNQLLIQQDIVNRRMTLPVTKNSEEAVWTILDGSNARYDWKAKDWKIFPVMARMKTNKDYGLGEFQFIEPDDEDYIALMEEYRIRFGYTQNRLYKIEIVDSDDLEQEVTIQKMKSVRLMSRLDDYAFGSTVKKVEQKNKENRKQEALMKSNSNTQPTLFDDSLPPCSENAGDREEAKKRGEGMRGRKYIQFYDHIYGIHHWQENEKLYYGSGQLTQKEMSGNKIQKNSPPKKLTQEPNVYVAEFLTDRDCTKLKDWYAQLMMVKFVKSEQLTAVPYPFKYLREWMSMERNTGQGNAVSGVEAAE